jgi:hypothetical protein
MGENIVNVKNNGNAVELREIKFPWQSIL